MKIIFYHYIRKFNKEYPNIRFLHINDFKKQLDYFSENYKFITKKEFIKIMNNQLEPIENSVVLTFDDGLKAQVQFVPEYKHIKSKWQMVVSIHKSSKLVAGEFKTIDDAAKYAHKTKSYEKEWVKTHVKFS